MTTMPEGYKQPPLDRLCDLNDKWHRGKLTSDEINEYWRIHDYELSLTDRRTFTDYARANGERKRQQEREEAPDAL